MATGHAHRLYVHRPSPVHGLPPQVKLVAAFTFVLVVVSAPFRQLWAFGLFAVLILAVAAVAEVPIGLLLRRTAVEIPFVLFAVLLPFISQGDRVDVLGLSLSVSGLWGAWSVLAKATLGVLTSLLLATTTELGDLVAGLDRLHLPTLIVQIMTFMIRYADVVTGEMRRMRLARISRGFVARDIRHLPVLARSLAVLFIRSFERGERVHLAMLSRGYTGRFPLRTQAAGAGHWILALCLPAVALAVAAAAWGVELSQGA
ncbi:MAG: cobalt/nickel transport system permease protein [Actinomycetota bacterium]|nr:cobalt/nickel transport system permease protein [Actinomycetota bacterium]